MRSLLRYALLILAVLLAYAKIFKAGFINWDDPEYVLQNPDITSFSWEHISNWFSHFYVGNYQPFTVLSYAIDFAIGKDQPFVYHVVNILLHTVNALMIFVLAKKLFGSEWVALFAGLLFALHPVQTECVSWIAERKTVLFGFFYLLSMLVYIKYVRCEKKVTLLLVYFFIISALLSKPAAVTIPFSLFAIDIWIQRSFKSKNIWLEKLPVLLAAIAIGIVTLKAQNAYGFLNGNRDYSFFQKLILAGYAYTQYIFQFIVPVKLSVIYPYPKSIGVIQISYAIIALSILVTGVVALKKGWNILGGGILFYTVNIALVLQLVRFGEAIRADRYMYVACLGIIIPVTYYLFSFLKNTFAIIAFMLVSFALLTTTYLRNDIWLSEFNFWTAIVERFPESSVAQSSMGGVYLQAGQYKEAMEHINEAISIDPNNYKAWYNRGVVLLRTGDMQNALQSFNKCLSINEYTKALFSRAILYQQIGEYARAFNDVEHVLQKQPENARAYYIKANCLEQQNNLQSALENYNKAISYDDSDPLFYLRRGIICARLGQNAQALGDLSMSIDKSPENGAAWYWRGIVKANIKQEPCSDLNQSLRLGYMDAKDAITRFCK